MLTHQTKNTSVHIITIITISTTRNNMSSPEP